MMFCNTEQELLLEHVLDKINDALDDLLSTPASAKELDEYLESKFSTFSGALKSLSDQLFGTAVFDAETTKRLQHIVRGVPIRVNVVRLSNTNAFTLPLARQAGYFSFALIPFTIARAVTSNISVSFGKGYVDIRNYDGSIYVFYTLMLRKILTPDELIAVLLHEVGHNIYALKRARSLIIPIAGHMSILAALYKIGKSQDMKVYTAYAILSLCTFIAYLTSLYNRFVIENAADTFVASIGKKYAYDLVSALKKAQSEVPSNLPVMLRLSRKFEIILFKLTELIARHLPTSDHPSVAGRIATLTGEEPKTKGLMAKLDAIMGKMLKKFWQKISS